VTKVDAGAVTLTASNSYSGVTTLFAGTLVADNSNALGTGNITFSSGGGNTGTIRYTAASAGTDWGARFKNSTGTIRLDTDGNNVALAGAIDSSNAQGLVKSGSGSLTLSGANAYTGTTSVTAGVLELASTGGAAAGGAEFVHKALTPAAGPGGRTLLLALGALLAALFLRSWLSPDPTSDALSRAERLARLCTADEAALASGLRAELAPSVSVRLGNGPLEELPWERAVERENEFAQERERVLSALQQREEVHACACVECV
jgi:autotransporter-associated beta strand protein